MGLVIILLGVVTLRIERFLISVGLVWGMLVIIFHPAFHSFHVLSVY